MNRIGIFGIGAIGSILAKYLSRNLELELYFFNRTKHKSIKVKRNQQEDEVELNLSTRLNRELDWLLICIKQYQIEEAKDDIQKLVGKQTKIAIFQNGINLSEPYASLIKEHKILETIIDCPTERIGQTSFKQLANPRIVLPKSTAAKDFICLFDNAEVKFDETQEFERLQWIKLIESSAIGSIQAVTGLPSSIFKEDKYLNDYKLLINEGIEVALSESIELGNDIVEALLLKLKSYPISKGSSMLTDKLNGKPLELNAKIGAILNAAKRNNINVPVTGKYYESLLNYNIETISKKRRLQQ